MAKIFLFRHAQTTDNLSFTFSGKRNPDLTPDGVKEAEKIRDQLKDEPVTKAFTAPSIRCKHTLEIVLEPHAQVEVIADPRILERDYGDLTGKNKMEIARLYPKEYPLWHRGYDTPPPHGESIKQVEERVLPLIKEIIDNVWHNDVILICATANTIRPIRRYFEKMTREEMCSFEHERGKIYEYQV